MKKIKKRNYLDSLCRAKRKSTVFDFSLSRFVLKYKQGSVFYSKNGPSRNFYTDHSRLYITPSQMETWKKGQKGNFLGQYIDGINKRKFSKIPEYKITESFDLYASLQERYSHMSNYWRDLFSGSIGGLSPVKMWNISIVGSLVFGMFLMTMIYRYLGQGASAGSEEVKMASAESRVLGEETTAPVLAEEIKNEEDIEITAKLIEEYQEMAEEGKKRILIEEKIRHMVKGYPIEKMVPEIIKKDKVVAAFLIGIAKKESNWGKRAPVLKGEDCFNYWGYRGKRERMGSGGHTCFDSPKDAVDTVGKRLENLVYKEEMNTPGEMVVAWKCGYDCSWDNPKAVKKWVSDVDMYFKEFELDKGK